MKRLSNDKLTIGMSEIRSSCVLVPFFILIQRQNGKMKKKKRHEIIVGKV